MQYVRNMYKTWANWCNLGKFSFQHGLDQGSATSSPLRYPAHEAVSYDSRRNFKTSPYPVPYVQSPRPYDISDLEQSYSLSDKSNKLRKTLAGKFCINSDLFEKLRLWRSQQQ